MALVAPVALAHHGESTDGAAGIPSLRELLDTDLEYICGNLQDELARMAGKALLITGGAGFLGYYLVQSVLFWNRAMNRERQIRLTVFDNYARGVPTWLTSLANEPSLDIERQDMVLPLPKTMRPFSFIVHAAGIASPTYYRRLPIETMDANINGLRNLLDYALAAQRTSTPVEGFLFFSSSEIYGDPAPEWIPTPEDYRGYVSCTGPRACYDESKRYGETLCVNFARQYGLPVTAARPFNNYGPGLKITDRRALPDMARDVLAGRDIVLYSDGSPTRTFCYSADSVTGYYKVLVKGHPGESYNIGIDGPEVSIRELAERVVAASRELFGYTGRVVHGASSEAEYLVDNPNRRCPVIDKARSHLGYDPRVTLDVGLRRSMIWYYHNQSAVDA